MPKIPSAYNLTDPSGCITPFPIGAPHSPQVICLSVIDSYVQNNTLRDKKTAAITFSIAQYSLYIISKLHKLDIVEGKSYDSGFSDGYKIGLQDGWSKDFDSGFQEYWRQYKESW